MPAEITGELRTLLTTTVFAPLTDSAFLRITGPDATRWLNGMVTNSIQALQPGEGNYNFFLNAQGRVQGDASIYREATQGDPSFLLKTSTSQLAVLQPMLDRFIIMDDVELTPGLRGLGEERQSPLEGVLLLGRHSTSVLAEAFPALDPVVLDASKAGTVTSVSVLNDEVLIFSPPMEGQVGKHHEIWANRQALEKLNEVVRRHLLPQASPEALEALRILDARPRYGTDIRNSEEARDLPQETNQTHALHFAKGCYLGQEIVERIRSRGQVHRLFTPFRLEGAPPPSFPAAFQSNGKPAGELTSGTVIDTTEGAVCLALGYARREFLEMRTPLSYATGTAHPRPAGKLY